MPNQPTTSRRVYNSISQQEPLSLAGRDSERLAVQPIRQELQAHPQVPPRFLRKGTVLQPHPRLSEIPRNDYAIFCDITLKRSEPYFDVGFTYEAISTHLIPVGLALEVRVRKAMQQMFASATDRSVKVADLAMLYGCWVCWCKMSLSIRLVVAVKTAQLARDEMLLDLDCIERGHA